MDKTFYMSKNKVNINMNDYKLIDDDHKPYKLVQPTNEDVNLDKVKESTKIITVKSPKIYDPLNLDDRVDGKYNIPKFDERDFNMTFLGFDEPDLKYNGPRKTNNMYLYGQPSIKEIFF